MHLLLLGVLFITTANSLSQSQNDIISSPDDSSSTPTEITQATDDVDDTWIDSAGLGSSDGTSPWLSWVVCLLSHGSTIVQPFGSDLVSSTPSKDQPSEVDSISSTASEDQPPGSDTISSTPSGDQPLGLNLVSSAQSEETAPDCVPDASNKRKRGFLFPFFTPAKPKPALCKPRQRAGFPLEDLKWGCPRDTQPYCCARHGHSFEYFHKNRELEISLIEYCLLGKNHYEKNTLAGLMDEI